MNQAQQFGFDDSGERVATVGFDYPGDGDANELQAEDSAKLRQETLTRTLDLLVAGALTAEQAGRRCLTLAYLSKCQSGPVSLAELGRKLRVSKQRAGQIVDNLKQRLALDGKRARRP
jgi:DNA-directed RNA polymerase sigma subunit (sigma70/sigma32)